MRIGEERGVSEGVSVEVGGVTAEQRTNESQKRKKELWVYTEVVKGHRSQATGHSASRGHLERRDTEMGEIK